MKSKYARIVLCLFAVLAASNGIGQNDNWLGGSSFWSNAGQWSLGLPGPTSDVIIYSGGDDVVSLDVNPSFQALTLGGVSNGTYSELFTSYFDVPYNLSIAGTFTIGQTGRIEVVSGSTVTAGALNNDGDLELDTGSNMNLASGGVTDVPLGSRYVINGTLTVGGVNNFFNNLNSIEGGVLLGNGQATNITPGSGTLTMTGSPTSSGLTLANGSTVNITGNVSNNGSLSTGGYVGNVNDTLNITGTLSNNGNLTLYAKGDVVNVGTLNNNGSVYVGQGATLNVTTLLHPTDIPSGSGYEILGTFNAGGQNAFASLTSIEGGLQLGNGQTTMITPTSGTLTNSRFFVTGNASTVNINGNVVNNLGSYFTTSGFCSFACSGGNTLNISGTLTNNYGGHFWVYGNGDVANVGTLVNYGEVQVNTGATLNVTTLVYPTFILPYSSYFINGTFNAGGQNAFANLTYVDGGALYLGNGQTTNITPVGGTFETLGQYAGVSVDKGSALQINGAVDNQGILATDPTGFGGGNTVTVSGLLTNEATGQINLSGPYDVLNANGNFKNAGLVVLSAAQVFYTGGGNNTLTVNGLLTNEATGNINLNGPGDSLQALGGLVNSGMIGVNKGSTVDPPFLNNLGTININSTSKFMVGTGSTSGTGYIQLANGTLGEMINSNASYGVINVTGPALLDGTLDIMLKPGFDPAAGTTFEFLFANPGQIDGTFANIVNDYFNNGTEKWVVIYDNADGYVELEAMQARATPEPASLLLLGSGLLTIGYGGRRRLKK